MSIELITHGVTQLARLRTAARWKKSTADFITETLITIDEHDTTSEVEVEPGRIVYGKRFPSGDERPDGYWYVKNVVDGTEIDVVIDKSRQNMVSHYQRGAEYHRVTHYPNFRVALIFEDREAAEKHITQRIQHMHDCTPTWFKDQFEFEQKKGSFIITKKNGRPWNSRIVPVEKSDDPLRGETYSWIVWEEMARQSWAKKAFKAVRPTIQGKRDPKTGKVLKGRFFAISTPQPYAFHGELLGDEDQRDFAIAVARGEVTL